MAEFINRENVALELMKLYNTPKKVFEIVYAAPAEDVAEVRYGKWRWQGASAEDGIPRATCTACMVKQRLGEYKTFCPNCGAKMGARRGRKQL